MEAGLANRLVVKQELRLTATYDFNSRRLDRGHFARYKKYPHLGIFNARVLIAMVPDGRQL